MAYSDYSYAKPIEVTDVNDPGSTIWKAQPMLLSDGDPSTTGQGDIIVDFDLISSDSNFAVYDADGNKLYYEIEHRTSTGAVLWVFPNTTSGWVRDNSKQAQVVYGDGPASSEENVTGTWNNTGQNAERVYHFNESSGALIDSSPNGNDSTNTVGTTYNVDSEINGGRQFDGTDDRIETPNVPAFSEYTVTVTTSHETPNDGNNDSDFYFHDASEMLMRDEGNGNYGFYHLTSGGYVNVGGGTISADTPYYMAQKWDGSTFEGFKDAVSQGTASAADVSTAGDTPKAETIGANYHNGSASQHLNGTITELRVYTENKSNAWIQADYDASPKAGQVFFTQQAAEPIGDNSGTVKESSSSLSIKTSSTLSAKTNPV